MQRIQAAVRPASREHRAGRRSRSFRPGRAGCTTLVYPLASRKPTTPKGGAQRHEPWCPWRARLGAGSKARHRARREGGAGPSEPGARGTRHWCPRRAVPRRRCRQEARRGRPWSPWRAATLYALAGRRTPSRRRAEAMVRAAAHSALPVTARKGAAAREAARPPTPTDQRPLRGTDRPAARQLSARARVATWLILPVVICLSQRLSHACVSMNEFRL